MDALSTELIAQILYFLERHDLMAASLVSKQLFKASRHPTLWKLIECKVNSSSKLKSLCLFFSQDLGTEALSLTVESFKWKYFLQFGNWSKQIDILNNLFGHLHNLKCLILSDENKFNSSQILQPLWFPPTLEHLTIHHLNFPLRCDNLRYLYLAQDTIIANEHLNAPNLETLILDFPNGNMKQQHQLRLCSLIKKFPKLTKFIGIYMFHTKLQEDRNLLIELSKLEKLQTLFYFNPASHVVFKGVTNSVTILEHFIPDESFGTTEEALNLSREQTLRLEYFGYTSYVRIERPIDDDSTPQLRFIDKYESLQLISISKQIAFTNELENIDTQLTKMKEVNCKSKLMLPISDNEYKDWIFWRNLNSTFAYRCSCSRECPSIRYLQKLNHIGMKVVMFSSSNKS